MSSTEKKYASDAGWFFFEKLVPLARQLHLEKESRFFQKKPDPKQTSYFVRREKVSMSSGDFEAGRFDSPEDIKLKLIRLWREEGHPELTVLADAVVKLAEAAHDTGQQTDEVSPFIYVMF